jgi:hypothetical protein
VAEEVPVDNVLMMSEAVAHVALPLKNESCLPFAGAGTKPVAPAAEEVAAVNAEYVVSLDVYTLLLMDVTRPYASTVMYGTFIVVLLVPVTAADGPYDPAEAPEVANLATFNVPEDIFEAFSVVKPDPSPDTLFALTSFRTLKVPATIVFPKYAIVSSNNRVY